MTAFRPHLGVCQVAAPVSWRTMFAVDAHKVRDTLVALVFAPTWRVATSRPTAAVLGWVTGGSPREDYRRVVNGMVGTIHAASARAVAKPRPVLAPVTTATRPFWAGMSRSFHFMALSL
jgi:hypothetical protein